MEDKYTWLPKAKEFLSDIAKGLSLKDFEITVEEKPVHGRTEIILTVSGGSVSALIGHRGDVLEAVQYLITNAIDRDKTVSERVFVDVDGYRAKRDITLQKLAASLAKEVKRTGEMKSLEPMNAYERHLIHEYATAEGGVVTKSTGTDPDRHITIAPEGTAIPDNVPAPRRSDFERSRRDRDRRRGGDRDRRDRRNDAPAISGTPESRAPSTYDFEKEFLKGL